MASRCFATWRIRGKCPEWEKTNNTGTKWLSPCVEPDIVLGLPSGDLSDPHNGPAMQISLLSQRYRWAPNHAEMKSCGDAEHSTMRRWQLLGQGHPNCKWQSHSLNPDLPDSEPTLLPQEAPGVRRFIELMHLSSIFTFLIFIFMLFTELFHVLVAACSIFTCRIK